MAHALAELTAAAGLDHPKDIRPVHFSRRVNACEAVTFAELYPTVEPSELLVGARDDALRKLREMARADSFAVAL